VGTGRMMKATAEVKVSISERPPSGPYSQPAAL
jgi:hypothetical protein